MGAQILGVLDAKLIQKGGGRVDKAIKRLGTDVIKDESEGNAALLEVEALGPCPVGPMPYKWCQELVYRIDVLRYTITLSIEPGLYGIPVVCP
ncbi:hypothetical protein TNCV_138861 [Trichonephila clavipes]|nr:hypothetical protein TNCV_138861 [Trichonephila clavipes]